jgi:type II secretory pathway component PulF
MRIPFLGKLSMYYNLANICRTLGLLLKSDIRIVLAMDLVVGGLKNVAYQEELIRVSKGVMQGQNISSQLRKNSTLFPPMLIQMVTAAEATGNLSGTLLYLSDTYEEEIDELTKNLTTLLEPILMIVMGVIVGFVAISIITPIYSITQNLSPYR